MEVLFEEILEKKNNQIIEEDYEKENHLILSKYTSKAYYKYSLELLQILLEKSDYINKNHIFHMSLSFLLKILYKFKNIPYIDNYDLLILISFSLGIKATVDQHKTPFVTKLKRIYSEKYSSYNNIEITLCEVICLKLLDYDINIFTPYECLYYLFNKDVNKLMILIKELENIIFNDPNELLNKKPYDLAQEVICNIDLKNQNLKLTLLLNKKTAPFLKKKDNQKIINNESTPTTSVSSSNGSNNNARNNFSSKKLKGGLRSQSNGIINNKSIINNINKELNHMYYNNFMVIRSNNSTNKENNNNYYPLYTSINNNIINNDNIIQKVIYKNINFKDLKNRTNKNIDNLNNIKLYKSSPYKKNINNTNMNIYSSKNLITQNEAIKLKKLEISNSKYSQIENIKREKGLFSKKKIIDRNTKNNLKNNRSNNLISNHLMDYKPQHSPEISVFQKPKIDKKKMKTSFKTNKKKINYKQRINFNTVLKNSNSQYQKISDLCKKINFDVFNTASEKEKSNNQV
jgi:hypothetical protein